MKKIIAISIFPALLLTGCVSGNQAVPSTEIKGYIAGKPFSFTGPKDVALDELTIITTTNGAVSIRIKKLNAVNNPDTVAGSYKGQADLVNAGAAAVNTGIEAAAKLTAAVK